MYEGKIIKFYRNQAKLTQKQLGEGICSVTHVSKIERGRTEHAPEIIMLLSKRLGIDIKTELNKLKGIKKRLDRWHQTIISEKYHEAEKINLDLKDEKLIQISDYRFLYKLLQARYHYLQNNEIKADRIINDIQKHYSKLPQFEAHLLSHVRGIYHLSNGENLKAIRFLQTIDLEHYKNPEYYYHLAVAYEAVGSPVMAYHYAEKALQFFKRNNFFLKVIDTEMLMLILLDHDEHRDFQETVEQYGALIESCDLCNAPVKKSGVLHNLAYRYLERNEYKSANELFHESMRLKRKNSGIYLLSFWGYIYSGLKGNLLPQTELLTLDRQAMILAEKNGEPLYEQLFNLLLFLIKGQKDQYYHYLNKKALPFFKRCGHVFLIKQSEKELFHYYSNIGENEKALEIAKALIKTDITQVPG